MQHNGWDHALKVAGDGAGLVGHAGADLPRPRILKISPGWPWKDAFLTCWQRLCALQAPA